MRHELRIPLTATGRLDRALADALDLGRAAVKRAFQLGEVRIGGRRVRASDPARPGALVTIDVEDAAGPPAPEPGAPLAVLLEHPRLVVVDKPAGVAVHPLAPGEGGTLANAVVARWPECAEASPDPREGGAVQRLDIDTSGCVAFARDPEAWEDLHRGLRERLDREDLPRARRRARRGGGVTTVPLAQSGGRVVAVPERSPRSGSARGGSARAPRRRAGRSSAGSSGTRSCASGS